MAKKASSKGGQKSGGRKSGQTKSGGKSQALVHRGSGGDRRRSNENMGDAFIKLLQSPLVAELVAVAATAALAALAENGFTSGGDASKGKRAGKAVKAAGKAAAAAVGRRLGNEIDEIRKAAKNAKAGAEA